MKDIDIRSGPKGFTLIELLVVVLILGILVAVVLPAYLSGLTTARQGVANTNARALAMVVYSRGIVSGSFDATLAHYSTDLGGSIPLNPCTATSTGYTISISGSTASVSAGTGVNCGTWTSTIFICRL